MSGVWVFKNGVTRLVENPGQSSKKKVLVYLPTGEVVSSYSSLEENLLSLGWKKYDDGEADQLKYYKPGSIELISLPKEFSKFRSVNMYDIVIKNRDSFSVRDSTE
ncbi:unnamed protein product [Eruca vesicaria subsp. sativa]|uniref:Flowering-promoting factor 1 n=1 Tax=Eruca vesicaria subsp. sativa TaxID=29727 RepID=A0ABC8KA56_ERUVS|nr:unnamed protein product [Eruca vesicaria subsp. sativa]